MTLKLAKLVTILTLVVGVILAVKFLFDSDIMTGIVSLVLLLLSGIVQAVFVHCPHCGKPVKLWDIFEKDCSYCGESLDEN